MIRRVSPSTTLARQATRSARAATLALQSACRAGLSVRRDREHLWAPAARAGQREHQRREGMTTGSRVTPGAGHGARPSATPQGILPTGIFFRLVSRSASITLTSFDGPFAV